MGFIKITQLVGGDWNHGIDYDIPLGMECHHPNCYSVHHFSEGLVENG